MLCPDFPTISVCVDAPHLNALTTPSAWHHTAAYQQPLVYTRHCANPGAFYWCSHQRAGVVGVRWRFVGWKSDVDCRGDRGCDFGGDCVDSDVCNSEKEPATKLIPNYHGATSSQFSRILQARNNEPVLHRSILVFCPFARDDSIKRFRPDSKPTIMKNKFGMVHVSHDKLTSPRKAHPGEDLQDFEECDQPRYIALASTYGSLNRLMAKVLRGLPFKEVSVFFEKEYVFEIAKGFPHRKHEK